MGKVEIRQATADDLAAFYGEKPQRSMKAYVGLMDGQPVGLAGVYYFNGQVAAFAHVKDMPKQAIGRGALKVLAMLKEMRIPVLAIAQQDIPTAPKFLERCGFEHVESTCQGEVYRWKV